MNLPDGRVIVDFYADWCGPCAAIKTTLEEIETEQGVKVLRFNVDEHRELAIENGVMSIPTLIMFRDGQETGRLTGAAPKATMIERLGIRSD